MKAYRNIDEIDELIKINFGIVCIALCFLVSVIYSKNINRKIIIASNKDINNVNEKKQIYRESDYEIEVVYTDEYKLSQNIDRLKIVANEWVWKNSNLKKKQDAMIAIIECQAKYWGIPYKLKIQFSNDLPDEISGYYSHSEKLICINNKTLNKSAKSSLMTTIHEVRHCYQNCMCEAYVKLSPGERNLLPFYGVDKWVKNINTYVSGVESYFEYIDQTLEIDARQISEERAEEYIRQINNILNERRKNDN